jgi:hypothetical protein
VPTPFSQFNNRPPERDDWSRNPSLAGGGNTMQTPPANPTIAPRPFNPTTGLDPRQLAEQSRYDYSTNPRLAMMNALKDVGFQTINNPYVERLLQFAPALATSFMGQRALNQGSTPADLPSSYGDFGRFLQQALQSGAVMSTAQAAQGMFPRLVNSVRSFNEGASQNDEGWALRQNPFLMGLANMFSADEGQGSLGLYGQLYSPFMSAPMQRSYRGLLDNAFTNSQRGFFESGDVNRPGYGGNDWWKYIFGY